MSEEKLKNLVSKYPDYKGVFEDVFKWFKGHPDKQAIRADLFYDSHPEQKVDFVFFVLESENITETIYRVLDDHGSKLGDDFNEINEIPESLEDTWGKSIRTDEALIMPYYMRNPNNQYDI